jgi:hypothetical protein
VEPELQTAIISDLGQEGWIWPPQLQIICHDVYQTTLARQDNTLRLAYYKERGAREIIGNYLEQTLRRLPAEAKQVLIALVSGDGMPDVRSAEDIAESAGLTVEETAQLLTQLEDERLVKIVMRENKPIYELAHAYLAASLSVDPEVLQRKAVEELLRRNLLDWQRYRILMSQEELQTLRGWAEKIDLSTDAQELLLRSAVQRNYDLPFWLQRIGHDCGEPILKEFLSGSETIKPQPEVALTALASVPQREPYRADLSTLLLSPSLSFDSRKQAALYLAEINASLAMKTLREGPDPLQSVNRQVIVELYNAEATRKIKLDGQPTWAERKSILFSRLHTHSNYILARAGTAGFAASIGGLLGSMAGYSLIQGFEFIYLLSAAFVPFVWATGMAAGITLAETLRLNRNLDTLITGAILGNLPLVVLAATDTNPEAAWQGLIYGLLGAFLSGGILGATLHFSRQIRSGLNVIIAVTGAAIAGLAYSLVLAPLVGTTDIPGFNLWSLAGILAGGSISMMLGLLFVPSQISVGTSASGR